MSTIIDERLQLDSYPKIDNSYKKVDYYRIPPTGGIDNVNRPGNIVFRCNAKEMFLAVSESLLYVKLKLTGVGDTMTLEHNAVLRMFSFIRLMFGSNEIENISSVLGEATTMMTFINTSESFRRTYGHIAGWFVDDHNDANKDKNNGYKARVMFYKDSPTLMIPLKLILGFTDYKKVLHQIDNMTLTLNRKSDAELVNEIFFGTAKIKNAANVEIEPKVEMTEFEWWIPNLTPNLYAEAFFEKRLNEKKDINMLYERRQATSVKFTTEKYKWALTGMSKQVRNIILAFKSEVNNMNKNNALMTLKNIRSIQVSIGGQLYPLQPMRFNTDVGDIAEPYLAHIEGCAEYNVEPQLSIIEFRDFYPSIFINTKAQPELLKTGNDVSVTIEKMGNEQYEVFALINEDCYYNHNISNGVGVFL